MKLIEADKVEQAIKDYWKAQVDKALTLTDGNEKRINIYLEHNHDLLKAIDELPSIQPEQRWIPVSERLPEDYGEFLVTYKSDGEQIFMDIIEYETSFEYDYEKNRFKGVWIFADDWQAVNSEVIAWMPLPELYQGGEQE